MSQCDNIERRPSLVMDWQSPHNKKWIRVVAVILIVAFIHQDLVWAQSGTPVWSKAWSQTPLANGKGLRAKGDITIPKDIAVTKEVYNAPGAGTTPRRGQPSSKGLARPSTSLGMSPEQRRGARDESLPPVVIHIQDAHSSLGAQESIVSILDSLVTNYNLRLVAIEGSSGYIDTSLLKTFPDESIRKKTASYLMKKGKMSAGEFFSITSSKNIALYGIEDTPLYKENVEQFAKIHELNIELSKDIDNLISALNKIKEKVYSDDLKALDSNSVLHQDGKVTFTKRWELVRSLAKKYNLSPSLRGGRRPTKQSLFDKEIASPAAFGGEARNDEEEMRPRNDVPTVYPNLNRLVESISMEKTIDFEKANKERDALIDVLTKTLPKKALEELVLKSLAFKTAKISQGDYYLFLQDLAKSSNIDPQEYSNLISYTGYITLYESIDLLEIFAEVEAFEESIKEKLFTNLDQRKLHDIIRTVKLIKGLFDLKLVNSDFEKLAKSIETSTAETIAGFVREMSMKYDVVMGEVTTPVIASPPKADEAISLRREIASVPLASLGVPRNDDERRTTNDERRTTNYDLTRIFEAIPQAVDFYKTAEARNSTMLSNTLKRMNERNESVAALITGGYHTKGISELLRRKETSYLVLMPKFDSSKGERPYVAILTNKKAPYEGLLKSGKFYLATSAYFDGIAKLDIRDPNYKETSKILGARIGEAFTYSLLVSLTGIDDEDRAVLEFKKRRKRDPKEATQEIRSVINTWVSGYRNYYEAEADKATLAMNPQTFERFLQDLSFNYLGMDLTIEEAGEPTEIARIKKRLEILEKKIDGRAELKTVDIDEMVNRIRPKLQGERYGYKWREDKYAEAFKNAANAKDLNRFMPQSDINRLNKEVRDRLVAEFAGKAPPQGAIPQGGTLQAQVAPEVSAPKEPPPAAQRKTEPPTLPHPGGFGAVVPPIWLAAAHAAWQIAHRGEIWYSVASLGWVLAVGLVVVRLMRGINGDDVSIASDRFRKAPGQVSLMPQLQSSSLGTFYSLPSSLRGGQTAMPRIMSKIRIATHIVLTAAENFIKNSDASIAARMMLVKLRHILNMPSRLPSVNSIINSLSKGNLPHKKGDVNVIRDEKFIVLATSAIRNSAPIHPGAFGAVVLPIWLAAQAAEGQPTFTIPWYGWVSIALAGLGLTAYAALNAYRLYLSFKAPPGQPPAEQPQPSPPAETAENTEAKIARAIGKILSIRDIRQDGPSARNFLQGFADSMPPKHKSWSDFNRLYDQLLSAYRYYKSLRDDTGFGLSVFNPVDSKNRSVGHTEVLFVSRNRRGLVPEVTRVIKHNGNIESSWTYRHGDTVVIVIEATRKGSPHDPLPDGDIDEIKKCIAVINVRSAETKEVVVEGSKSDRHEVILGVTAELGTVHGIDIYGKYVAHPWDRPHIKELKIEKEVDYFLRTIEMIPEASGVNDALTGLIEDTVRLIRMWAKRCEPCLETAFSKMEKTDPEGARMITGLKDRIETALLGRDNLSNEEIPLELEHFKRARRRVEREIEEVIMSYEHAGKTDYASVYRGLVMGVALECDEIEKLIAGTCDPLEKRKKRAVFLVKEHTEKWKGLAEKAGSSAEMRSSLNEVYSIWNSIFHYLHGIHSLRVGRVDEETMRRRVRGAEEMLDYALAEMRKEMSEGFREYLKEFVDEAAGRGAEIIASKEIAAVSAVHEFADEKEREIDAHKGIPEAERYSRKWGLRLAVARITDIIEGGYVGEVSRLSQNVVLVVEEMDPGKVRRIKRNRPDVKALVCPLGSSKAHWVVLAEQLGFIVIAGAHLKGAGEFIPATQKLEAERPVIVDTSAGILIQDPREQTWHRYRSKMKKFEERESFYKKKAPLNAVTKDQEVELTVLADVGDLSQIEKARSVGASGVGLYRLEWLYEGATRPTEEEMEKLFIASSEQMRDGEPLTIRLLDMRSDKKPITLNSSPFTGCDYYFNPAEGNEGRQVAREELRAIFKAYARSEKKNIEVLFPMASAEYIPLIEKLKNEIKEELAVEGIPKEAMEGIKVGGMIETPRAVEEAADLFDYFDFVKVGMNDLYNESIPGADRDSAKYEELFSTLEPVILGRLVHAAQEAKAKGKPMGICGRWASNPRFALFVLRLIRICPDVSVTASIESIPRLKEIVRNATVAESSEIFSRIEPVMDAGLPVSRDKEIDKAALKLERKIEARLLRRAEYKDWSREYRRRQAIIGDVPQGDTLEKEAPRKEPPALATPATRERAIKHYMAQSEKGRRTWKIERGKVVVGRWEDLPEKDREMLIGKFAAWYEIPQSILPWFLWLHDNTKWQDWLERALGIFTIWIATYAPIFGLPIIGTLINEIPYVSYLKILLPVTMPLAVILNWLTHRAYNILAVKYGFAMLTEEGRDFELVGEANSYLKSRLYNDAIRCAQTAAEINPTNKYAWTILAQALFRAKRIDEAITALSGDNGKTLKKLLERDPVVSYSLLAHILIKNGDKVTASQIIQKMLAELTNDVRTHLSACYLALEMDDSDRAVKIADEALYLFPHDSKLIDLRRNLDSNVIADQDAAKFVDKLVGSLSATDLAVTAQVTPAAAPSVVEAKKERKPQVTPVPEPTKKKPKLGREKPPSEERGRSIKDLMEAFERGDMLAGRKIAACARRGDKEALTYLSRLATLGVIEAQALIKKKGLATPATRERAIKHYMAQSEKGRRTWKIERGKVVVGRWEDLPEKDREMLISKYAARREIFHLFRPVWFLRQHDNTNWKNELARGLGIIAIWTSMTLAIIFSTVICSSFLDFSLTLTLSPEGRGDFGNLTMALFPEGRGNLGDWLLMLAKPLLDTSYIQAIPYGYSIGIPLAIAQGGAEGSDALPEDIIEIPHIQYRQKPERRYQRAEEHAAIELQKDIAILLSDLKLLNTAFRNARADDEIQTLREQEHALHLHLANLYRQIPVEIKEGKPYEFYSKVLKDLKARQMQIYRELEEADTAGDKKALQRLNLEAIRLNKLLAKVQIKVSDMILLGRSRLPQNALMRNAAIWTLQGALNSSKALEEELHYRVERLRGKERVQKLETTDWLGRLVMTFRLGGFDIEVIKPASDTEEPRISIRQQRWINAHTTLDQILQHARRGEIPRANVKMDMLIGLYSEEKIAVMERYADIASELNELKRLIAGLPNAQPPPQNVMQDISTRIKGLIKRITHPKQAVWQDIRYGNLAKSFRSQIHTVARYKPEYILILRNKADLEYFAGKLRTASEQSRLSKRNRRLILGGLARIAEWTGRGFVYPKQFATVDLTPAEQFINGSNFRDAQTALRSAVKRLERRLSDIDNITSHVKNRAAAIFSEFRDADIAERIDALAATLAGRDYDNVLDQIQETRELYFGKALVEPGYIRAEHIFRLIESAVRALRRTKSESSRKATEIEVKSKLNLIKDDIAHKRSFRVAVTFEDGKGEYRYINPGTTVNGLLKMLGKDPGRTLITVVRGLNRMAGDRLSDGAAVKLTSRAGTASLKFLGEKAGIHYSPFLHAPTIEELVKVGIPYSVLAMLNRFNDTMPALNVAIFAGLLAVFGVAFTLLHLFNERAPPDRPQTVVRSPLSVVRSPLSVIRKRTTDDGRRTTKLNLLLAPSLTAATGMALSLAFIHNAPLGIIASIFSHLGINVTVAITNMMAGSSLRYAALNHLPGESSDANNDEADIALERIRNDKSLENVYESIKYLTEQGTLAIGKVAARAITKSGQHQEEFLGEFITASALAKNIRYSKVLEMSVENFGSEIDCVIEVDRARYSGNTAGRSEVEDGIYLVESKTEDRSTNVDIVIEQMVGDREEFVKGKRVKTKLDRCMLNALAMRKAGYDVKGLIFAVNGDAVQEEGIQQFKLTQLERGTALEVMAIGIYAAFIPDVVIKRDKDGLSRRERNLAEIIVSGLRNEGKILEQEVPEYETVLKKVMVEIGAQKTREAIMEALRAVGADPISHSRQTRDHWRQVFESLKVIAESKPDSNQVNLTRSTGAGMIPFLRHWLGEPMARPVLFTAGLLTAVAVTTLAHDEANRRYLGMGVIPNDRYGRFIKLNIYSFMEDLSRTTAYKEGRISIDYPAQFHPDKKTESESFVNATAVPLRWLSEAPRFGQLTFAGVVFNSVNGKISIAGYRPEALALRYWRDAPDERRLPTALIHLATVKPKEASGSPIIPDDELKTIFSDYQTYHFGEIMFEMTALERVLSAAGMVLRKIAFILWSGFKISAIRTYSFSRWLILPCNLPCFSVVTEFISQQVGIRDGSADKPGPVPGPAPGLPPASEARTAQPERTDMTAPKGPSPEDIDRMVPAQDKARLDPSRTVSIAEAAGGKSEAMTWRVRDAIIAFALAILFADSGAGWSGLGAHGGTRAVTQYKGDVVRIPREALKGADSQAENRPSISADKTLSRLEQRQIKGSVKAADAGWRKRTPIKRPERAEAVSPQTQSFVTTQPPKGKSRIPAAISGRKDLFADLMKERPLTVAKDEIFPERSKPMPAQTKEDSERRDAPGPETISKDDAADAFQIRESAVDLITELTRKIRDKTVDKAKRIEAIDELERMSSAFGRERALASLEMAAADITEDRDVRVSARQAREAIKHPIWHSLKWFTAEYSAFHTVLCFATGVWLLVIIRGVIFRNIRDVFKAEAITVPESAQDLSPRTLTPPDKETLKTIKDTFGPGARFATGRPEDKERLRRRLEAQKARLMEFFDERHREGKSCNPSVLRKEAPWACKLGYLLKHKGLIEFPDHPVRASIRQLRFNLFTSPIEDIKKGLRDAWKGDELTNVILGCAQETRKRGEKRRPLNELYFLARLRQKGIGGELRSELIEVFGLKDILECGLNVVSSPLYAVRERLGLQRGVDTRTAEEVTEVIRTERRQAKGELSQTIEARIIEALREHSHLYTHAVLMVFGLEYLYMDERHLYRLLSEVNLRSEHRHVDEFIKWVLGKELLERHGCGGKSITPVLEYISGQCREIISGRRGLDFTGNEFQAVKGVGPAKAQKIADILNHNQKLRSLLRQAADNFRDGSTAEPPGQTFASAGAGRPVPGPASADGAADATIAGDGHEDMTRASHDRFHGNLRNEMRLIGEALVKRALRYGIKVETYAHRRAMTHYDIEKAVRGIITAEARRGMRHLNEIGDISGEEVILRIPRRKRDVRIRMQDEILVIINPHFNSNHAGRNELAVYAQNETKVVHEMTELKCWMDFAENPNRYGFYPDRPIATEGEIFGRRLGDKLMLWANQGEDALSLAKKLRKEFHQKACRAEFARLVGQQVRDRKLSMRLARQIFAKLPIHVIEFMIDRGFGFQLRHLGSKDLRERLDARQKDLCAFDVLTNRVVISERCLMAHTRKWFEHRVLTYVNYKSVLDKLSAVSKAMPHRALAAEYLCELLAFQEIFTRYEYGERLPTDLATYIRRFTTGAEDYPATHAKSQYIASMIFKAVLSRFADELHRTGNDAAANRISKVSHLWIMDIARKILRPILDRRLRPSTRVSRAPYLFFDPFIAAKSQERSSGHIVDSNLVSLTRLDAVITDGRKDAASPDEWTKKTVIAYIQEHYDEVGSPAKKAWLGSPYSAVVSAVGYKGRNLFGRSWPRAVKAARFEIAKKGGRRIETSPAEWTEESVIQYIKAHYDEVSSSSINAWLASGYSAVVGAVEKKENGLFDGSWPNAIEAVGYSRARIGGPKKASSPPEWTEETAKAYFREHYEEVGSARQEDWVNSEYSAVVGTISSMRHDLFDRDWRKFVKAAGHEPVRIGARKKSVSETGWTEEKAKLYIQAHHDEVGSSAERDWKDSSFADVVKAVRNPRYNLFSGSWQQAIIRSGYKPARVGRKSAERLTTKSFSEGVSPAGKPIPKDAYISSYEGIVIYDNSRIATAGNLSPDGTELADLMRVALPEASKIIPKRGPPVYVHVAPEVKGGVKKDMPSSGEVHLWLDAAFVNALLRHRDRYPDAIPWLLAERLGHELTHDNKMGTDKEEAVEERDVILKFDLPFYRMLSRAAELKREVDRFFGETGAQFGGRRYFKDLLVIIRDMPEASARAEIERYINRYYELSFKFPESKGGQTPLSDSTTKSFPAGEGIPASSTVIRDNEESINFDEFGRNRTIPVVNDESCLKGGKFYNRALKGYGSEEDVEWFEGIENIFNKIIKEEGTKLEFEVEPLDVNPMVTVRILESPDGKRYIAANTAFVSMIAYLLKNRYNRIILTEAMRDKLHPGNAVVSKWSCLVTSIVYSIAIHQICSRIRQEPEARQTQYRRGERYMSINITAMLYYWSFMAKTVDEKVLMEFLGTNYRLIGESRGEADTNRLYYIEAWREVEKQRELRRIPRPEVCDLYSDEYVSLRRMHGFGEFHQEAAPAPKRPFIPLGEAIGLISEAKRRQEENQKRAGRRETQRMEVLQGNFHLPAEKAISRWIMREWNPADCFKVAAYKDEALKDDKGNIDLRKVARKIRFKPSAVSKWLDGTSLPSFGGIRKIAEGFGYDLSFVMSGIEEDTLMKTPTIDAYDRDQRKLLGLKIEIQQFKKKVTTAKMQISAGSLRKYKEGSRFPPLEHIRRIASAFGMTPASLLGVKSLSGRELAIVDLGVRLSELERFDIPTIGMLRRNRGRALKEIQRILVEAESLKADELSARARKLANQLSSSTQKARKRQKGGGGAKYFPAGEEIERLITDIRSGDSSIREAAEQRLRNITDPLTLIEFIDGLTAGFNVYRDSTESPRAAGLIARLSDSNTVARAEAAEALGKLGPAAAAASPVLIMKLRDGYAAVREAAKKALIAIGPCAVPDLIYASKDSKDYVSQAACEALGRILDAAGYYGPFSRAARDYHERAKRMAPERRSIEPDPVTDMLINAYTNPEREGRYGEEGRVANLRRGIIGFFNQTCADNEYAKNFLKRVAKKKDDAFSEPQKLAKGALRDMKYESLAATLRGIIADTRQKTDFVIDKSDTEIALAEARPDGRGGRSYADWIRLDHRDLVKARLKTVLNAEIEESKRHYGNHPIARELWNYEWPIQASAILGKLMPGNREAAEFLSLLGRRAIECATEDVYANESLAELSRVYTALTSITPGNRDAASALFSSALGQRWFEERIVDGLKKAAGEILDHMKVSQNRGPASGAKPDSTDKATAKHFPAGEEEERSQVTSNKSQVSAPSMLLGIPRRGHSDVEIETARAAIRELAGSKIAVEVLDEGPTEDSVNKLVGLANERRIPYVRILDPENLNNDAMIPVIKELMKESLLDRKELVRIVEFLKKSLDTITRVDIDEILATWQKRTLRRDPSIQYIYQKPIRETFRKDMPLVSATTQDVVDSGLSWAARIQNRWDMMTKNGISVTSKKEDPVKEVIIITDPKIDASNVDKYLSSRGLDKYIDTGNVIFANTPETKTLARVEDMLSAISEGISKDRIGIRCNEGELSVGAEPQTLLVQLRRDKMTNRFVNINMYEVLFDLLADTGNLKPIPGLVEQVKKHIFIYLPPMIPRDYQAEMDNYSRTVEHVMKAA